MRMILLLQSSSRKPLTSQKIMSQRASQHRQGVDHFESLGQIQAFGESARPRVGGEGSLDMCYWSLSNYTFMSWEIRPLAYPRVTLFWDERYFTLHRLLISHFPFHFRLQAFLTSGALYRVLLCLISRKGCNTSG